MYLLADSGSTKTEWVLLNDELEIKEKITTSGFNPNIVSTADIINALSKENIFLQHTYNVDKIFFYGAGCSHDAVNEIIKNALLYFFPKTETTIKNDLYAAVYATAGNEPSIVCILGTGSNSCRFDGQNIYEDNYSLGYILGDEGSGSYLGKKLVRDYFYHALPADIHQEFYSRFNLKREDVIEQVYRKSKPNLYLASYVPFLKENIRNSYCSNLVFNAFDEFINYFVMRFTNYNTLRVHFAGSVAFEFSDILISVLEKHHLKTGKIIASPMQNLIQYTIHKLKK